MAAALHHPAHLAHASHASGHAGSGLLGRLGDDCLGHEDVLRDRGGVLQRRARDHRWVDDAGLDQVLDLVRVDVQALALGGRADLVDDDRGLEARVLRELADRLLERPDNNLRARPLVRIAEAVQLDRPRRVQERDAAAGDDALLERRPGRLDGVLDAVLLLLHLGLGGSADLDHGDAARQLREPLLELLAIEVGVGVLDLGLELLDPGLDRLAVAGAVDDRRRVLVDNDLAGVTELRELRVLQLETQLLGDHLAAGENPDVLEHPLAAVTEAGRLHRDGLERAAQLVDDDRRERLALDVLRHDQQRLAGLDHLLEHGQEVLDGADLLVGDKDVRVLEHGLHALGVGDHVRRQVALVELHPFGELELEAERLAFLDVDDAVLAHLLDRVRDHVADLALAGGDGGDAGDVLSAIDVFGLALQVLDDGVDRLLDPALERHRIRTGGYILQALAHNRLGKQRRRRRAVTRDVVRRRRDLAHKLRTLVLKDVLDLDLTRDRDAVVRDRRRAEPLVQHHVPTLRAKRDPDRISEDIHTTLERAPRILIELQLLVSHLIS